MVLDFGLQNQVCHGLATFLLINGLGRLGIIRRHLCATALLNAGHSGTGPQGRREGLSYMRTGGTWLQCSGFSTGQNRW